MSGCRFGVTGHRRFHDRQAVTRVIDDCIARHLHDSRHPPDGRATEIWSSLAEGADRLVVERVLLADPEAKVRVVLPFEPGDYRRDFDTAESRAEFDRLLDAAASVVTTGSDASGTRESAYERAGLAVLESSDVLIAVWDGQPARGRGGTAHVVAAARSAGRPVCVVPVIRDAQQSGEVVT